MRRWETTLLRFMETTHPEVGKSIIEEKKISPENEARLSEALSAFMSTWQ
jgi:F-type H+-transporting ATPase subunit alpha